MDRTPVFLAERPRLVALAGRVLDDPAEAEDIAQQAWLRLHGAEAPIANLPAWLTTVTVRLCLDRLKARTPEPVPDAPDAPDERDAPASDPADQVAATDTVAAAVHVVLDRLSPTERVAFVLHESFAVDFPTIAALIETSPAAARKLASRARAKVAAARPADEAAGPATSALRANAAVVDAFLAAARHGQFARLLALLAPGVVIASDAAATALGAPDRIEGRDAVAAFFDGAAAAALPVFVGDRPGAAWYDRGDARVAFDFTVRDGLVARIDFSGDPQVLARLRRRRRDGSGHTSDRPLVEEVAGPSGSEERREDTP